VRSTSIHRKTGALPGHLLNWYDIQTLARFAPLHLHSRQRNLAVCLITLRQGLLALRTHHSRKQQWQGLLVILDILKNTLQLLKHELEKDNPGSAILSFEVELDNIYERVTEIQDKPEAWTMILTWLSSEGWETVSHRLMELLEGHPNLNLETLRTATFWIRCTTLQPCSNIGVCTLALAWTDRRHIY
jgi:hypothetical protein